MEISKVLNVELFMQIMFEEVKFFCVWSSKNKIINIYEKSYAELSIFLVNKLGSEVACWNLMEGKVFESFEYHCRVACFSLYRDSLSLQTWEEEGLWKPFGSSIYTVSFKSPWRKALFISSWWRGHLWAVTMVKRTLHIVIFATGEKVSMYLPLLVGYIILPPNELCFYW